MIDINKTYETKSGNPVTLYTTDAKGSLPVHGSVHLPGCDRVKAWNKYGEHVSNKDYDLVEVKPRIQHEIWINVYKDFNSLNYDTKQQADENASLGRLACVKLTIDCEYGEGLE